jgi:hypothetical protein
MVRAHSTAKLPTSPLMSSFDHARHTATQRANIHCLERTDLSTFRYTYELLLITGTWSVYLQALVNQLITGVSPSVEGGSGPERVHLGEYHPQCQVNLLDR